ncbi:MAG: TonB-dependent receptor domain-containing protein, partial [Gammaproteobacteria bacterium]
SLVPMNPGDPNSQLVPKSQSTIGGSCTLPAALSGDPYLPQIFANSYEFGLRGTVFGNWHWNAGIYRTDIKDDIYLVGITPDRSFFDSIGETRRQGIEFGFSGSAGIVDFKVNYSYVDATFQSHLYMLSPHNSSAAVRDPTADYGQTLYDANGRPLEALQDMIEVSPGDRMPGIPEHNINATLNFHMTEDWSLAVNMIAHTSIFVRGNENNEHSQGAYQTHYGYDENYQWTQIKDKQYKDSGSLSGFAIFNLRTQYQIAKGIKLFGMVNNLFDRQYATAGRLGVNPFSPSTLGAVGASGWNYNSREWQNRSFLGPGAPRSYWVGLEIVF